MANGDVAGQADKPSAQASSGIAGPTDKLLEQAATSIAAGLDDLPIPATTGIKDYEFISKRLGFLKSVRQFILQQAVKIPEPGGSALDLGPLNTLTFQIRGRAPTMAEWDAIERKTRILMSFLSDDERKRFQIEQATRFLIIVPLVLTFVALIALAIAIFPFGGWLFAPAAGTPPGIGWKLGGFLVWLGAVGGIGSISYIYVNALAIQVDQNVNAGSKKFVIMRTILGSLFAEMLTIPYGFSGFLDFCDALGKGKAPTDAKSNLLLLMPFVLGFSTPLVLAIMGRMVESIQVFVGIKNTSSPGQQPP